MKANTQIIASSIIALAILVAALLFFLKPLQQTLASVSQGSEQISTTTSGFFVSPTIWNLTPLSTSSPMQGEFGSFVQTTVGTEGGNINCYDATTTSVLLRKEATSSILVATLPTNAAVGNYIIDSRFYRGLICVIDGTVGTTTITGRW